ncbi:ribonuclease III [Candidatus Saccharibacteria bacterium]|nr:ribonuclease III [Candidatus Saccharibacteria bacterium]
MNKEVRETYENFAKEKLGFEYNDINLLITALTHRSYVNEHKNSHAEHNERLEFLGDAVLELVVSDFLYRNYDQPEGIMTAWRSALVRTDSICDAGKKLGYDPLIRLSNGEKTGSARARDVIMADCFEAVVGSIYLDQGYEAARKFIEKHILSKIDTMLEEGAWRDPKSFFQEVTQHYDGVTPVYRTVKEDGPDHDKTFTVEVYVGRDRRGTGEGHSKQEAQGKAAYDAIKYYRKIHEDFDPMKIPMGSGGKHH